MPGTVIRASTARKAHGAALDTANSSENSKGAATPAMAKEY